MSDLFEAIYNCRDSLIKVTDDRSDEYLTQVLSKASVTELSKDFSTLNSEELGDIAFIRPTEGNGLSTRNMFVLNGDQGENSVTFSVGASAVDLRKYLDQMGYGDNPSDMLVWDLISYCSHYTVFVRMSVRNDTYFHELFTFFMLLGKGSRIVFINDENKPDHLSSITFYSKYFNLLMSPELPLYLKLKIARMTSTGTYAMINPITDWIRCVEVKSTTFEKITAIRLKEILPYITLTVAYIKNKESYSVVCRKILLNDRWGREEIDVGQITRIINPTEMLKYHSFAEKSKTVVERLTDADYEKNNPYETIVNGFNVALGVNPLDRICREAFLLVCNCLEEALFDSEKKIYMQDVVVFDYNGEMWVSAMEHAKGQLGCSRQLVCHTGNDIKSVRYKGISLQLIPINDRYYTQDIDCTVQNEDELETIRECVLYGITKYLNYRDYLSLGSCEKILGRSVTGLQRDLLNHNLYFLESHYLALGKRKTASKVANTSLDPLGAKTRYLKMDDTSTQRMIIPL